MPDLCHFLTMKSKLESSESGRISMFIIRAGAVRILVGNFFHIERNVDLELNWLHITCHFN